MAAELHHFNNTVNSAQEKEITELDGLNEIYKGPRDDIEAEVKKLGELKEEADKFNEWIGERFLWADVLQAVRQSMIKTEAEMRRSTGQQVGVWVAAFNQVDADAGYEDSVVGMYGGAMGMGGMYPMGMNPMMMQMYGMGGMGGMGMGPGGMGPGGMGMPPGGTMPPGGAGEPGNPVGGMGMNPMMGMGGMYGMGGMGMQGNMNNMQKGMGMQGNMNNMQGMGGMNNMNMNQMGGQQMNGMNGMMGGQQQFR